MDEIFLLRRKAPIQWNIYEYPLYMYVITISHDLFLHLQNVLQENMA
jgi:hypothetical protein